MKLIDYFIEWAESGVHWNISEGTYPQEVVKQLQETFKENRRQLRKKFEDMDGINDIFNTIIMVS